MNVSREDDLHVGGFNRDLRVDRDDAISLAKSFESMMSMASSKSNHSLVLQTNKSDSSGSPPQARAAAAGQDGAIEVDFYRNPTILSRMILYNKFVSANKRCRDHPLEASVWVCAKRKSDVQTHQVSPFYGMFDKSRSSRRRGQQPPRQPSQSHLQPQSLAQPSEDKKKNNNTEYSLRQLPIHIACTSLAFAHDTTSRTELEQLIVRLVVTYPEGCAEFDHGGKLPVHEAIWSNASPETTAMLLMASPKSIERRDKSGRTPMELNHRRTGNHKAEIRDMLNLGVKYWDNARQEARLRMKLAVIPPTDKSISSTSVMGTSQLDKESIYTTDTANYDSTSLKGARTQPHPVQIESEEIVPMAWEQLERRVLLLEQLLAEVYEKNYELGGVVEALKNEKQALTVELEAARVAKSAETDKSKSTSAKSALRSVAVVPEDNEISSLKLMEHTERVEQLESLVGSIHSTSFKHKRKRRNRGGSGSRVSELSSFSSTNDGAFVRDRAGLARQDSMVSGLTAEEASVFDTSIHAVKDAWRNSKDEDDAATNVDLNESGREVSEVMGTDNLNEMFHKAAEMHESSRTFSAEPAASAEPTPRKEWVSPISSTSFLPTHDIRANFPVTTTPMAVEEEDEEMFSEASQEEEEGKQQGQATQNAGEIYFPGFRLEAVEASGVNSTISISASSAESSTLASGVMAMSENSTIVSDENEIYFAAANLTSLANDAVEDEAEVSDETMSTKARLENIVFGSSPNAHEDSESSDHEPQRYNYDIKIPALDTFYEQGSSETGEI